ncbi:MAG: hypothetical protein ACK5PI_06495 [Acetobacteraceae bacterium]
MDIFRLDSISRRDDKRMEIFATMSAALVAGRGNSRGVLVSQPARADRVQMGLI